MLVLLAILLAWKSRLFVHAEPGSKRQKRESMKAGVNFAPMPVNINTESCQSVASVVTLLLRKIQHGLRADINRGIRGVEIYHHQLTLKKQVLDMRPFMIGLIGTLGGLASANIAVRPTVVLSGPTKATNINET